MRFCIVLSVFLFLFSLQASAQSCSSAADCPSRDYCDGDAAIHVDVACIDGLCETVGKGSREECLDRWYCVDRNLTFVDGYCLGGSCVEDAPVVVEVCDDVRYCDGNRAVVEHVRCDSTLRACEFDWGMPSTVDCEVLGLVCSGGFCVQEPPGPILVPEFSTAAVALMVLLSAPALAYLSVRKRAGKK